MKRFNITVNGKAYDVQVEEVGGAAAVKEHRPRQRKFAVDVAVDVVHICRALHNGVVDARAVHRQPAADIGVDGLQPGQRRVIAVVRGVRGKEGVQAELLRAQPHQLFDAVEDLPAGHAVFRIAGVSHDGVAEFEIPAGIIAQADGLRNAAVLRQEVDVRVIVKVDDRAQLARVFKLARRGIVGGEHDVLARDAQLFAQHQLGLRRAVHAAAVPVQQLQDCRVRAGLDRVVFLVAHVPLERALQIMRCRDYARLVVNMERRGVFLYDLLHFRLVIGKSLHGRIPPRTEYFLCSLLYTKSACAEGDLPFFNTITPENTHIYA